MNRFRLADDIMGYNSEDYNERMLKKDALDVDRSPGIQVKYGVKSIVRTKRDDTPGCPIPLVGRMITFDE